MVRKRIFLILLYLTPFGYIIDLLQLLSGKKTTGITLKIGPKTPVSARVNKKFTGKDRLNWFFQGLFLLSQALYIFTRKEISDISGAYGLMCLVFGSVSLISGIFPKMNWNRNVY